MYSLIAPGSERPNTRMQSDRFARKIMAILVFSGAARLRRLMRRTLDGTSSYSPTIYLQYLLMTCGTLELKDSQTLSCVV